MPAKSSDGYEYGVRYRNDVEPHRTGMTKEAAEQWCVEWQQDGGAVGAFHVIRRHVGEWQAYTEERPA